jgi:hypothetical protein
MSLRPDVVVIGFGLAGAVAAREAAGAGARVVALSRRHAEDRAQDEARAAGVEVRAAAVAHELLVEDGRVVGVGYGVPAPPEVAGCPFCDCAGLPGALDPDCAATPAFVGCSAVVLALDAGHWDFVGPAVWSAVRGRWAGRAPVAAGPGRLTVLRAEDCLPEPAAPELITRRWCAERDAGPVVAARQAPLHVDDTGAVTVGHDRPVAGLFSAVPAQPGEGGSVEAAATCAAARQAGRAAASTPVTVGRPVLRSVG